MSSTISASNFRTDSSNTAVGYQALINNTTGSNNTVIGYNAGYTPTTGSNNTFLGTNTDASNNLFYSTAIGYGAVVDTSNQIVLGRSSESVKIPGNLIFSSSTSKTIVTTPSNDVLFKVTSPAITGVNYLKVKMDNSFIWIPYLTSDPTV